MTVENKWDRNLLPVTSKLSLTAKFYRDSNRASDIDNLLKMVMDFLQTAGVIKNDDQVREVYATVNKPISPARFEIELNFLPK